MSLLGHYPKGLVVNWRHDEELRLWIVSYDAQRVLLDDSSATKADIETVPPISRFHLVSFFVAWVEAVGPRLIATKTNPSVFVTLLAFDKLVAAGHRVLTVPHLAAMSTPPQAA